VTEARLRRYERWTNAAALFVALQVTGFEMNHGIFGGLVYYVSLLTPFGVAIVVDRWFRARAREQRSVDWRAFAWLRSALMLREEWWNSRRQIARAWLLIGLVLGGIALAVYRDVPTAAFVGAVYPGVILLASVWHFRHPPDSNPLPVPSAGWYRDPSTRHQWRYFDGTAWTAHVADDGIATIDPIPRAD